MIQCLLSTIVKHQCTTVKAESVNNKKLSTQVFSFLGIKVERQQTFTKLISTYNLFLLPKIENMFYFSCYNVLGGVQK